MTDILRTDVLVVGSGPAGGAAALSLARPDAKRGLARDHDDAVGTSRYPWLAFPPALADVTQLTTAYQPPVAARARET